jgi:peptidoglycan/LPS O-acetylase OafA/YrhL
MLRSGSPGRPRLAHIEGLRAVAALAVVATHVALISGFTGGNPLGPLTARLNVGVALFFVLSAYLLYGPRVDARLNGGRSPGLRRYATRRALRILPAYWAALIVLGLLLPGEVLGAFGSNWWAYFGLLQVYSTQTIIFGLGVAWSLSTEVAFYVVLPVLAWTAARSLGRFGRETQVRVELAVLAVSAALAFLARWVVSSNGWMHTFPNTVIGDWPWFAVGLGLAVARAAWGGVPVDERPRVVRSFTRYPWVWWGGASAVLLFAAYGGVLPRNVFAESAAQGQLETLLFALFALCLVGPVVLGDRAAAPARDPARDPAATDRAAAARGPSATDRSAAARGPSATDRSAAARGPSDLLALAPVAWLGTISYGIFLWHYPLALWTRKWIPGSAWLFTAVTLGLTIACAALSWYALERPLMRLGAGRPRSRAALATVEASEPAP